MISLDQEGVSERIVVLAPCSGDRVLLVVGRTDQRGACGLNALTSLFGGGGQGLEVVEEGEDGGDVVRDALEGLADVLAEGGEVRECVLNGTEIHEISPCVGPTLMGREFPVD